MEHLRHGFSPHESLLLDAQVVCHPFVIVELACGQLKKRKEIIRLLEALPMAPILSQGEIMVFIEGHNLSGRGLGFVDVHLLASAKLAGIPLWTIDKKLKEAAL